MFYYILSAVFNYNFVLIAAAVIPAVVLMVKVYKSDRLEAESPALLWSLLKCGVLAALLALVEERILCALLDSALEENSRIYGILLYFVVVAVSEESSKYLMLRRGSWNNPEFNCQYDGVVYAVFVALGFAVWENISYVLHYGFGVALVRAVTAIPGHACFGVFMGVFYGLAKKYENSGVLDTARIYRILAVLIPVTLHGAYDYIATYSGPQWVFIAYIALLFIASYRLVAKSSKEDRYI